LSKRLPTIILDLLQKLDVYGDEPIILANDDILPSSRGTIDSLIKQSLLFPNTAKFIACIGCEGQAKVSRTGSSGKNLFASCTECGSHFPVSKHDTRTLQVNWVGFSAWLSKLMNFPDEPEAISGNVYFIGHITHTEERFEVYLAKELGDNKSANASYSAIGESLNGNAIVLSLSINSIRIQNSKITIIPVRDCLKFIPSGIKCSWPEYAFSMNDPTKRRAARTRWDNDPLQKQKIILKDKILSYLHSKFAAPLNHAEIKGIILSKHSDWLQYKKVDGEEMQIKDKMLKDIIKEVLTQTGQSKRITGKYYAT